MANEDELVSYGEGLETEISGKLRKNNFNKGEKYYVSLDKKMVNVKTQLRLIMDKYGIDASDMSRMLEVYQNMVVDLLSKGYSVKILDLVTVSPTVRGSVDSSTAAASQSVGVKVSSLPKLTKAVEDLTISTIEEASSVSAEISEIEGKGTADGSIVAGKSIRVVGKNLKTGVEGDGVYFVSADENGSINMDRSSWIKAEPFDILTNMPSELIVAVPSTLSAGKYVIIVETRYVNAKSKRKDPLFAQSKIFDVKTL